MTRSSEVRTRAPEPLLDLAAAQRWAKVALARCDALATRAPRPWSHE